MDLLGYGLPPGVRDDAANAEALIMRTAAWLTTLWLAFRGNFSPSRCRRTEHHPKERIASSVEPEIQCRDCRGSSRCLRQWSPGGACGRCRLDRYHHRRAEHRSQWVRRAFRKPPY